LEAEAPSISQEDELHIKKRIQDWKSRLVDLSRRNNLLFFRKTKRGNISISSPSPEDTFNRLILRHKKIEVYLPPEEPEPSKNQLPEPFTRVVLPAPSSPSPNQLVSSGMNRKDLEKTLKNLHTRSLSDYRERGVRILHAAFGMLVWKENDYSEEARSPLLLVPIELERESVQDPYTISVPPVEDEVILNPALKVKLEKDFKIELPPHPEEWDAQSLSSYFNLINQAFAKTGWKVEPALEIGLFSFHKLVIYNDLDTNSDLISKNKIVRAIAGVKDASLILDSLPEEKEVDKIEKPEQTFQVLDADSSQRIAIQYAINGQSFVMQGPPGTGKSQTIANIISECIARGKTVLFVSDKMAALEVVYKRLSQANLQSFCLELHSSKANKLEVVTELKRCLDVHTIARNLPSSQEYENMKSLRENLNNYIISLHQIRQPLGKNAYEVLGRLAALESVPYFVVDLIDPKNLTTSRLQTIEAITMRLQSVWQVSEEPEFPWRGYNANTYNIEIRSELSTLLDRLILTINTLRAEASRISEQLEIEIPANIQKIQWLIAITNLIKESPKPEASWLMSSNVEQLIQEARNIQNTFNGWQTTRITLGDHYNALVFALSIDTSANIAKCIEETKSRINLNNAENGELFEKREQLLSFLSLTTELSRKWNDTARELAEIIGLPAENLTIEHVKQLAQIATICSLENKPEKAWLDPICLQQTAALLPKAKKDFQERNNLKDALDKKYIEQIIALNLDELILRYGGPYRSVLRWLRPSFYHDQKQIALISHDGRVPDKVIEDLILARKLRILEEQIKTYNGDAAQKFGNFYNHYNTDFEKIENALKSASDILKLSWIAPLSENLKMKASSALHYNPRIGQLGYELLASIEKWSACYNELSNLLPFDFIHEKHKPVDQIPLLEIQEWAPQAEDAIRNLNKITNQAVGSCITKEPQNYQQLLNDLKTAEQLREEEKEFLEKSEQLRLKFGSRFIGIATNWEEIIQVFQWANSFKKSFGPSPIPGKTITAVTQGSPNAVLNSALARSCAEFLELKKSLETRFEKGLANSTSPDAGDIAFVYSKATILRQRVDDLQAWVDFKNLSEVFAKEGLADFLAQLCEHPPAANQLIDVFRKGAYQEWLNAVYDEDQNIGKFRRENHEQLIAEFKKLDNELIHLASNRVVCEANKRKPQGILVNAKNTETSVLFKEAAKKRRHMPIRNLFQRIPNILTCLKPCLLMSPISVSQFLTPGLMHFDLTLFDEASQIVPEDSIGAIYRGDCIVIAGDDKQLPPTAFFQKSLIDDSDWEEIDNEDIEVFDSILDVSMGIGLPIKTLRWHYRSKHEDLISFSNHRFYDDKLVTFPSATRKHDTLGVKLVYIPNGIYDRGGRRDNIKEAEAVSKLVFEQFKNYPHKTLGVVTFSFAQMEAVQEALERLRKEKPEYERFFKENRLDGFFVKNLESVQGDERDVIIFSVGYGRDQRGVITMNFGPLNKQGGERRLNVAITRAKEEIFLVSSIKSADIDFSSIQNSAGVLNLYHYLDYAERGPIALQTAVGQSSECESPMEADVAAEIRQMGYDVIPQVGCSGYRIDLGVVDPVNPGNFLMGVECDGATYHSSYSARDRDRLREQVLKQLGWRIHRIWSPTWVLRRESEIRRLGEALKQASSLNLEKETRKNQPTFSDVPQENDEQARASSKKIAFSGTEKIGTPYQVCTLTANYPEYIKVSLSRYPHQAVSKNKFSFSCNRELQMSLLEQLVKKEGPIHFDYAVQRIIAAWGLRRSGSNIVQAMKFALYQLVRNGKVVEKECFLWPPGLKDVPVRTPVPGVKESERKPEYIPPEEIEKAMKLIVQYAFGISPDSLITETARVFAFNRTGENIREEIEKSYKRLLREKKLICSNNTVTNSGKT
jgi:very-short-patch-repair endonuclease